MHEARVDVKTPDGTADSKLFTPSSSGAWPAVILLPDIMGVRPVYEQMAQRMAGEGFAVLLPNIYYRTGPMPVFKEGTPTFATDDGRAKLMAMKETLTSARMTMDGAAYVDFLSGHASVKSGAKMGVAGYCMTGRMALYTAGARPDRIGVAASFHGGQLFTDAPDSPHLLLPQMKAHLYIAHATDDHSMPADAIVKLDAALREWGGRFDSETRPAKHGWCVADFPVYDREEAERAWEKLVSLFKEELQ